MQCSRLIISYALMCGMSSPALGDEILRSCATAHNLSVTEAKTGRGLALSGVVTFFEKPTNSSLIIQDDSGGIYVNLQGIPFSGTPGERVEITGTSAPGDFAPVVLLKSYRLLGPGTMPEAMAVTRDELQMGYVDCLRIKFRSRVRAVSFGSKQVPITPPRLVLELGDHQAGLIQAHLLDWQGIEPESLIDAEVELKGISSGHFNDRRQIMRPRILVQNSEDLQITKAPLPPEEVPVLKIGELFTYRSITTAESRVRFEGVVVAANAPDWLAVQESSSGILLQPAPLTPVKIGDAVRVLGYPIQRDLQSVVVGARIEVLGNGNIPAPLPLDDLRRASGLQGCRVLARGRLLEPPAMIAGLARLRLKTATGIILVEVPDCVIPPAVWQPGAQLAATGVCLAEYSPEAMARRFPEADRLTVQVLGPGAIELCASAPWWTPQRLAYAAGGLLVVLAAAGYTVWRLGAKAQRLTARGRELARAALLRTTQLHEQLATQHEQQLTFQAVLHERQRLAQELHDSIEQQFASLSLYAEAVLAEEDSASPAGRGLSGVRKFIEESRGEVRRCIWGLRARALDQRGIGAALHELARQHNAGAGPRLTVLEKGTATALEATRENHLFRFAQEAVGNALKHANSTQINLSLEWMERMLRLSVEDNGCGLPAGATAPASLRHRAEALSATMDIAAREPVGTRVTLEILVTDTTSSIPDNA